MTVKLARSVSVLKGAAVRLVAIVALSLIVLTVPIPLPSGFEGQISTRTATPISFTQPAQASSKSRQRQMMLQRQMMQRMMRQRQMMRRRMQLQRQRAQRQRQRAQRQRQRAQRRRQRAQRQRQRAQRQQRRRKSKQQTSSKSKPAGKNQSKKQDAKDDDDDAEEETADGSDESGGSNKQSDRERSVAAIDEEYKAPVPATMREVFRRWFPPSKSSARKAAAKPKKTVKLPWGRKPRSVRQRRHLKQRARRRERQRRAWRAKPIKKKYPRVKPASTSGSDKSKGRQNTRQLATRSPAPRFTVASRRKNNKALGDARTVKTPPTAKRKQSAARARVAARLAPTTWTKVLAGKSAPSSSVVAGELLVRNLTDGSAVGLTTMGLEPKSLSPAGLTGGGLTRLVLPPAGLSGSDFDRTRELLKGQAVFLNRRYRLFNPATGGPGSNWRTELTKPSRTRCPKSQCYGAASIKWRPSIAKCVSNIKIGVIDTAFDHKHPAFAGRNIKALYVHKRKGRRVLRGHGTGILALLAGSPNSSTPGLLPDAQYMAIDIFKEDANGQPTSDTASLYKALLHMQEWGAHVVNLSLVGPKDKLIKMVLQQLSRRGTIVIAAGGNEGPAAAYAYPAAYTNVVAVTAVDRRLRNFRYANRGTYIDLAAPGVDIWTAGPAQKERLLTGTSLATPFVTSVVAALYHGLPQKTRLAFLSSIRPKDLGRPGKDPIYGHGLVQLPNTSQCAAPTVARIAEAR